MKLSGFMASRRLSKEAGESYNIIKYFMVAWQVAAWRGNNQSHVIHVLGRRIIE